MPKLFVKSGLEAGSLELRIGSNRIGRGPDNHFQIMEPSVSSRHCEVMLGAEAMVVTDLGSSNGTFIDGVLVREGFLFAGQILRLGQVELGVESRLQIARTGALTPWHQMNAVRETVGNRCLAHPHLAAEYYCAGCNRPLCKGCVYSLRQASLLYTYSCRNCGAECHAIASEFRSVFHSQVPDPQAQAQPEAAFAESVRRSLIPHLAAWLKQKFIQVLLQQREGLIQTQEAATEQMRSFEQRLVKIQTQMEQRIETYQQRIRALESELAASEAENRVLIESQIATMRAELERESRNVVAD